jgi:hypothetical protein
MLLLTAKIFRPGAYPPGTYDAEVKTATVLLADGRTVFIEVREVVVAFELDEVKP